MEPTRRVAAGGADPGRRRRCALSHQPVHLRERAGSRRGRGDRPSPPRGRARAVRDGLAPGLPEVRLRGGELCRPARRPAPLPLPGVPQRVRGGDGRPHRDLLQRLAPDPRHPLPPSGDARSVRLHLRVQGGTRGAHARRRVLPRRGPLSAARGRVPRAGRDRPVHVRGRTRRAVGVQLGHGRRFRAGGRGRAHGRAAAGAPHLSRQRLSAGGGRAGPGPGQARGRQSDIDPRRARHHPGFARARKASFWPSTRISPASTCSPARRSGACSVPRWWVAPKASRSAT